MSTERKEGGQQQSADHGRKTAFVADVRVRAASCKRAKWPKRRRSFTSIRAAAFDPALDHGRSKTLLKRNNGRPSLLPVDFVDQQPRFELPLIFFSFQAAFHVYAPVRSLLASTCTQRRLVRVCARLPMFRGLSFVFVEKSGESPHERSEIASNLSVTRPVRSVSFRSSCNLQKRLQPPN